MKSTISKWVLKAGKWVMIGVCVVVCIVCCVYGYARYSVTQNMEKEYTYAGEEIEIPMDKATVAYGRHQAYIRGCMECHGTGLQGKIFLDDPLLGLISTPNLTTGKGGLVNYTVTDWTRALKHGINRKGNPIPFMPSQETSQMTKEDMAAVIAFCRQLPPVDNEPPQHDLKPMFYILGAFGVIDLETVEKIDHNAPFPEAVKESDALTHGKYLTVLCSGCHRENMKGGDPLAPGFPPVPDISSSGNPGHWSLEEFKQVLRTGKTPEGKAMLNENMPWQITARYTDTEILNLYLYLKSLK